MNKEDIKMLEEVEDIICRHYDNKKITKEELIEILYYFLDEYNDLKDKSKEIENDGWDESEWEEHEFLN